MTNAIQTIVVALNEVFAPMDEKFIADQKVWAMERKAAIADFWNSDFYKANKHNSHAVYTKLFALAGGKTWYQVLNGRNEKMVHELVTKNCLAVIAARNTNIALKLEKANVTELTGSPIFSYTYNGFNGTFNVVTNVGPKRITIKTIYAGGYYIQCFHMRTLVHVF